MSSPLSLPRREMHDMDGPEVSEQVHQALCKDGKLCTDAVPYALDLAVRKLRESGAPPERWATYIHLGA
jgi:hypothetical protein